MPTDRPYFLGIIRYQKHIIFFIWPNRENDTFLDRTCDGYSWLHNLCGFRQNPLEVIYTSIWPFARHTASTCLYFPALSDVYLCHKLWQPIKSSRLFSIIHTYHTSCSYLRVNMGCAFGYLFQAHSFTIPTIGRPPFMGSDLGVPSL